MLHRIIRIYSMLVTMLSNHILRMNQINKFLQVWITVVKMGEITVCMEGKMKFIRGNREDNRA